MKGLFKYVCLGIMVIFSGMFFNLNNVQAKENTVDLNNVQKIPAFCYHDVVADNDTQILEKDPYAITQKFIIRISLILPPYYLPIRCIFIYIRLTPMN